MRKYKTIDKIHDDGRFVGWRGKSVPKDKDGSITEDGDHVLAAEEDVYLMMDRNEIDKRNFERQCKGIEKMIRRIEENFYRPEIADKELMKIPGNDRTIKDG